MSGEEVAKKRGGRTRNQLAAEYMARYAVSRKVVSTAGLARLAAMTEDGRLCIMNSLKRTRDARGEWEIERRRKPLPVAAVRRPDVDRMLDLVRRIG